MSAQASREQRQQAILEILHADGAATVADLGQRLAVAEMTIRRDLESLEAAGVLQRYHGGARLITASAFEPPIAIRERTNAEGKRAIAAAVAGLVDDGETIVVDGGSTGVAVAAALAGRRITVCPLSIRVAWAFEKSATVDLLIPPGSARRGELSVSGAETIEYLRAHHFDRYVLTASAFALDDGFTEWNVEDAAVKRAAIGAARTVVAAVDASKFGRSAFVEICPLGRADVLVLDRQAEGPRAAELRTAARALVVADEVTD
ncbi:MAG: DeoR/GlpR family DNA-binding transcription regulator [Actinobacteria bacterium]|nr:DeoR/GlpR family DNA-binding transcription regulator [Actinomycetota bacterium]